MKADALIVTSHNQALRSERPRLLPVNRKLRHLHGITLRNLEFGPVQKPCGGKAIDDEALSTALRSPARVLATNGGKLPTHSESCTNFTAGSSIANDASIAPISEEANGHVSSPQRPNKGKVRRRSTLNWDSSPKQRQKRLQDAVDRRLADVFFSLHVVGQESPLYVSEVAERTVNPNFRHFDLNTYYPSVTRRSEVTVKFWARSLSEPEWHYLIELSVSLSSLQYVGTSLEELQYPLPENCILFHIDGGIHASPIDNSVETDTAQSPRANTTTTSSEATSSYDALMRLATLNTCIQDAINERDKLISDINTLVNLNKERFIANKELASAQDSLTNIDTKLANEREAKSSTLVKVEVARASLAARRNAMRQGHEVQVRSGKRIAEISEELSKCKATQKQTLRDIAGQKRRICETLLAIFPIEALPHRSLTFTICGLALPNSDFSDVKDEAVISAALGHVAHVVYLLSFYLATPLPYPLQPCSSTSSIRDPISLMGTGNRSFPLYMKGSVLYRFEYAVFLLNKNIECLADALGMRVLDIRQTLPNLKLVLVVVTGGKGDAPGRKTGGVRGLLRDSASPASSRAQSVDSFDGKAGEALRRGLLDGQAVENQGPRLGTFVLGKGKRRVYGMA